MSTWLIIVLAAIAIVVFAFVLHACVIVASWADEAMERAMAQRKGGKMKTWSQLYDDMETESWRDGYDEGKDAVAKMLEPIIEQGAEVLAKAEGYSDKALYPESSGAAYQGLKLLLNDLRYLVKANLIEAEEVYDNEGVPIIPGGATCL